MAEEAPEAMVVMFGANDAQGMALESGSERFGSPTWLAEYRRRVGALMVQLTAGGRSIYWVGQPIMRSEGFSARMATLNEIYASEAASRADVTYIDTWTLLSVDGAYSAYIDDGGGPTLMRQSDGIHLSRAGGDRVARAILTAIHADWPGNQP
ncbi:MAG TPA: GDSL-type esterase/lipase family protein [Acidimicrobiales bacterium]|nr:GDSL-type esterase/lipase family protein [Acidimicrobiales bacterium]